MEFLKNPENSDEVIIKMSYKELKDLVWDFKPFFEFGFSCLFSSLNSPR